MPDSAKEADAQYAKSDVHVKAKESHRQVNVHAVDQSGSDLYDLMTDRLLGGVGAQDHSKFVWGSLGMLIWIIAVTKRV